MCVAVFSVFPFTPFPYHVTLPPTMASKKPSRKRTIIWPLIGVLIIGAWLSSITIAAPKQEAPMNVFITALQAGTVGRVEVAPERITYTNTDGTVFFTAKEVQQSFSDLIDDFHVDPSVVAKTQIVIVSQTGRDLAWRLVPSLILAVILGSIAWFLIRQMQGAQGKAMGFGQAQPKDHRASKQSKTTFNDVAGAHEAKQELQEIVEFLKNPKKFDAVGAKIPKGVLMMGRPGTGKTLIARAVAGEAQVPFFHMSGSEFVEMFVGVGASRVRDLFAKAKKEAPCIVFIDEIDAVGRQRGAGLGGGHDEREQTLNQILVEMDGFETNSGIIVMAATNRPDVLDPALLRPGRFDRQVTIDIPDLKEREAILKIHAANKPLASDVDLTIIAKRTAGFSGADLANILNEAAILTARSNETVVTDAHVREAIEKVMIGPARKNRVISDKEKRITAYHEAGHAIVGHFIGSSDEVHKISIISRGRAAGYTMKLPQDDNRMESKNDFLADLAMMLGGRVAEAEVFGDVTTGASDDLKKATALAKAMVKKYGMVDDLGPRTYGRGEEMVFLGRDMAEERDYADATAQKIDEAVRQLVANAQETARTAFRTHREAVDKIVAVLLEKESIEKEEFEQLVGKKPKE